MPDFVSEEQCVLCSAMRSSERATFRENLNRIPLSDNICNACLIAFWRNIGFPVSDDGPTQH
jgi:hypothetical protein